MDVDMNKGRRKSGFSTEVRVVAIGWTVVVVVVVVVELMSRRGGRRRAMASEDMPAAMPQENCDGFDGINV